MFGGHLTYIGLVDSIYKEPASLDGVIRVWQCFASQLQMMTEMQLQ